MAVLAKKVTKGANPMAFFFPNSPDPLAPFPRISLYRAVYRWANPLAPFVAPFPYFVAPFPSRGEGGHLTGSWTSYRRRPSDPIAPSLAENPAHEVGDG